MASGKAQIIADGGIRERCCERISQIKCLGCGTTLYVLADWETNENRCPDCGESRCRYVCTRCEKGFDEIPTGGDHPCGSIVNYEKTSRIAFEEEMRATQKTRRRAEEESRHHPEELDRRRAEDVRKRAAEYDRHHPIEIAGHPRRVERTTEPRKTPERRAYLSAFVIAIFEVLVERIQSNRQVLLAVAIVVVAIVGLWAGLGYVLLKFEAASVVNLEQALTGIAALGLAALAFALVVESSFGGAVAIGIVVFLGAGFALMSLLPFVLTGSRNFWAPYLSGALPHKVSTATPVTPAKKPIAASGTEYQLNTSVKGKYVVLRNSNVRNGPGPRFDVASTLPELSDIVVLGRHEASGWYQVAHPSSTSSPVPVLGFISGKLITAAANCRVETVYEEKIESWKPVSSTGERSSGGNQYLDKLCTTSEERVRKNMGGCPESDRRNYSVQYEKEVPQDPKYFSHCRAKVSYECPVKKRERKNLRVCSP